MSDRDEDKLTDSDTQKRRDEALKRALNTPPKPRNDAFQPKKPQKRIVDRKSKD